MKAIILAAGVGKRLRKTTTLPKCLLEINQEPLLYRYISCLNSFGIKKIVIVVGYKAQEVVKTLKKYRLKAKIILNNRFSEGSILSLWAARKELSGEILLMDADVYFEKEVLRKIVRSTKSNFFVIDRLAKRDMEAAIVGFKGKKAQALGRGLRGDYDILGEWAGFLRLSAAGTKRLKELLAERIISGDKKSGYEFILPDLFVNNPISYELIDGLKWVEIDFPKDVKKAEILSQALINDK